MLKEEGKFKYLEEGEGSPVIMLHGLLGGVDNFGDMVDIVAKEHKVFAPDLQLFETPLLNCTIKNRAKYIYKFMKMKKIKSSILIGNSLGGHVALVFSKLYPVDYDKNAKFLGLIKFNNFLQLSKNIIPLGGIKIKNLNSIKNIRCHGFALFSEVKKKPANIINRLF